MSVICYMADQCTVVDLPEEAAKQWCNKKSQHITKVSDIHSQGNG